MKNKKQLINFIMENSGSYSTERKAMSGIALNVYSIHNIPINKTLEILTSNEKLEECSDEVLYCLLEQISPARKIKYFSPEEIEKYESYQFDITNITSGKFTQEERKQNKENYYLKNEISRPSKYQVSTAINYENALNKDICEFTTEDALTFYRLINTSSLEMLIVTNSTFLAYTDYCISKHIVNRKDNPYKEMTKEILNTCVNTEYAQLKILTREQVLAAIGELPNPVDQFIILGLFEGISGKDYCELGMARYEDIQGNEIKLCTGRTLTISDELKELAKTAANEYDYNGYSQITGDYVLVPLDPADKRIVKQRTNSGRSNTERQMGQRILIKLTNCRNRLNIEGIRSKALNESGRIAMIKGFMKETDETDIRKVILSHATEIECRYGRMNNINRFLLKYGEFF